jgi:hypothetical protein
VVVGEVLPNICAPRAAARLKAPAARRVFTGETMRRARAAGRNFVKPHKGFRSTDAERAEGAQLLPRQMVRQ